MTEKMKPSGISWIGDIPGSWFTKRIKYLASLKGRIGWQGLTSDEYIDEGPYLITGVDFQNGSIDWNSCVHISEERWAEAPEIHIQNGDLLITKDGTIGKVAIVSDLNSKASLNSGVLLVRTLPEFDKRFLFWVLQSEEFWTWFRLKNAGNSTIVHLYQGDFAEFCYTYPELQEQKTIANYLDTQCAKIDSIAADLEKQIELLQKYKKSLITETVTKGLDKSVPMKDSGVDWIGKIPLHWRIIRITKYLDSLVDYRGKTPEKVDDGVFLVTARNIKNGIVDYSLSQEYVAAEEYEQIMHRGKPEIGDVLFTTEAPLGEVANVDRTDIALAQRVIKFRGRKGCVDNYYLKYWLMSLGFQSFLWSLATGSTALGIAASKLGQLKMVLPPIDEQKAIAERLDCDCTNIDAIIVEKRKQLETAQQYKKSLIYEYVTGKKRVTEVN